MEPLWSPGVATGGNRSQIAHTRKRWKQAKTVAVGCDQLPRDGKAGVSGSSPEEGFRFACLASRYVRFVGEDAFVRRPRGVHRVDVGARDHI